MNILDHKYKHKSIIKYPVPYKDTTCTFYFRRMQIGEWLTYLNNSNDPTLLGGLIKSLVIDSESEYDLFEILVSSPGVAVSIAHTVSEASDFTDYNKCRDIFRKGVVLASSPMSYVIQHILSAYPAYKLTDVLELDTDDFLMLAAFAESKMGQPAIVDYFLFNHLYKDEYMKKHDIKDDSFEYTYELHLQNLNGNDTSENKEVETFVTDNGRVVRGNRTEYLKRKAYEKEMLKRKSNGLPPISAARFFTELDHEGIDPETLVAHQNQTNDVATIAAMNAKNELKKKLAQEKEMSLSGVKTNKTFSWQNDKDVEL